MHEVVQLIPVEEKILRGNIQRDPKYDAATTVYARMLSIGEREFYDAAQAGFRLEAKFEIWQWEYANQRRLIHNGKEYEVLRTYRNDKTRRIELSCECVEGRS